MQTFARFFGVKCNLLKRELRRVARPRPRGANGNIWFFRHHKNSVTVILGDSSKDLWTFVSFTMNHVSVVCFETYTVQSHRVQFLFVVVFQDTYT